MQTYNQIIAASQAFAAAHKFLKNFGNGQPFDIAMHNQTATYKYPLMWMEDKSMPIETGVEVFGFRVYFLATVATVKNDDGAILSTNVNEVKSDMLQCAKDFISYWVQDHNYDTLSIEKTAPRETLEDAIEDRLTGCYIDIRFRQAFPYNSCIVPMTGVDPPASNCAPVFIYENGLLVATIVSGGQYSYETGSGSITTTVNGVAATDSEDPLALNVVDSANANIGTPATDTANEKKVSVANSTVVSKDSLGNVLHSTSVKAENTADQTISNAGFTVQGVAKTGILAEGSKAVSIVNSADTPLTIADVTDANSVYKGSVADMDIEIYEGGLLMQTVSVPIGASEEINLFW